MDDKILVIYGLCTDFLTALHHTEDRQQKLTDAEVMTTALVAMVFFGGNFDEAQPWSFQPTIASDSRSVCDTL